MSLKSLKTKDRLFLSLVSFVALFLNFNQQAYAMKPDDEEKQDTNSLSIKNEGLRTFKDVKANVANDPSITSLRLFNTGINDEGIRALKTLPLQSLSLTGFSDIKEKGLKSLGYDGNFPNLKLLTLLSNQRISSTGMRFLTFNNSFSLTLLNLYSSEIGLYSSEIGVPGVKVLATSNALSSLTSLNLESCHIKTGAKFLGYGQFSSLTALNLKNNGLRAGDINFLTVAPYSSSLKDLDLGQNLIRNPGVKTLTASSYSSLHKLGLINNKIGDEGMSFLARALSGNLSSLTDLNLSMNEIREPQIFVSISNNFSYLISLNLERNKITDNTCKSLKKRCGNVKLALQSPHKPA